MTTQDPYDLIVIGAGLSGLALAWHSQQAGHRTLVLEAAPTVGGCMASPTLATAPDGPPFWTELGAHSLFNSYGGVIDLLAAVGLHAQIRPKKGVSFQLWTPDQRRRRIVSALHWGELLRYGPSFFRATKAGRTVAEYYGEIVGPRNYARVFGPAFNAVSSQDAGDFPADALFGKRSRRKDFPRSFSLADGLQALPQALAARLTVVTSASVTHIDAISAAAEANSPTIAVTGADGRTWHSRRLALATPVQTAAALLTTAAPAVSAVLREIETTAIYTTAVVLPKTALSWPATAGLIGVQDDFYSAVSRDYLPDAALRAFTFHFKPPFADADARLQRIAAVLQVPIAAFVAVHHKVNTLPMLRLGHHEKIAALDRACLALAADGAASADVAARQPLLLTGNYFTGLSLEDGVQRSLHCLRQWSMATVAPPS